MSKKTKIYILLALIIALGFFLRIYNINNAPPGVYPDEAVNGQDALKANDTGQYQWFYPDNNGREGLFINLIALSFKLFGVSILTLKLPSIIFGTLTILGIYLLAKELFGQRVGLISSFLVAVSFWPLDFSRIAFRAIMVPFLLSFSFYFLFKGLRTKKLLVFAFGGIFFGLGLHTYIAFRVAPLILAAALIFLMLSQEKFIKIYWKHLVIFTLFASLAAAPMFYTFFYAHPEYWASRTSEISILNPAVSHGYLFMTFLKTFGLSLAKYNFWGDQNWRQNYPPYPILDFLTGIAFLSGFIYLLIKSFHSIALRLIKKIHDTRMATYLILLTWFFAMLMPEFMGADSNPHALRAIGTLPVVFIFAGLAFNYVLKFASGRSAFYRKIVIIFLAITFVFIGIFNTVKYFYFWANKPQTAQAFETTMTDIKDYIKTLSSEEEIFVAAGNMQRVPVRIFNWNNPNFHDLHPMDIDTLKAKDINNTVIIFTDFQKDQIIRSIDSRFCGMKLKQFTDSYDLVFYTLSR